ncbi:receptor-like protein 13 isoform X10 [Quercus robur]|uniref:receptor-like protein 13 isoform X10 n=1 Tax=Quercus robur TaxID=38942 RepID=UPI0021636806|nr:receptor-like protein 13 isoform X10 [Quercus robur]
MGRSLVKWLLWGLIVLVHLHGHRGCFEEERMGLLEIKEEFARSTPNATIRDYLSPSRRVYILPSWVDDYKSECCEWERVTCDSTTGHVTHLSLHNIWEFDTEGLYYYFIDTSELKDMVWFLNVSLFESLKELRSLNLSFNGIGGWIEHKVSESLLRLNKLESLDLDSNIFNQSIIQSLRLLTSLKSLNLSYNALEGSLPTKELSVFEDLEILDLSNNRLNGSETVQGSISLLRLKKLERLDLGSNGFKRSIIQSLRLLKSLKTLSLRYNNLEGSFPIEELSVFEDLEKLDLSNNELNGSLTIQDFKNLSKLSKLKHLDLRGNHFDEGILRSLGALSALTSLKLDNNEMEGPLYDQGNASLRSLEVLNLGGNNFNGSLPKYLANLRSLEVLNLGGNNFNGSLPKCEIPLELGQLQRIHALNLSHNQLTGSIPKSFSDLTNVESLDLSHNRLSGEIPPQLIELTFLEVFSVAYNNLSGRTPDMKAQFGTFDASSYDGNPFLCGLPLEKNCTGRDDSPTPMHSSDVSDERWYKVDQTVFFTSFSVTYIMFCLGVITVLYINTHWRLWYYNLAEDCMYSCYFSIAISLRKLSAYLYN